jgi:hypothetical protein
MATVVCRAPLLLVAAESVTVPLPVPDAPLVTVSQLGSPLVAVHEHQLPVVTLIDPVSPAVANSWLFGDSE